MWTLEGANVVGISLRYVSRRYLDGNGNVHAFRGFYVSESPEEGRLARIVEDIFSGWRR